MSDVLVVSRGSRVLAASGWRRVAGSALAAGAVRWRVRRSGRAFSGTVMVAGFWCFVRAVRFARAWAGWCGVPVAVRVRSSAGVRVWAVSVPVSGWSGSAGEGSSAGAVVWWALP